MNEQNGHQCMSISGEYEHRVLEIFKEWYRQGSHTINEASTQAYIIARDTARLTATEVILLLQEHPEWTYQVPRDAYSNDAGRTIGEITSRHFVKHLETVIQNKGLQVVCAGNAIRETQGENHGHTNGA